MSNYSIGFIEQFPQTMAVGELAAPVDWVQGGYLFIVPPAGMAMLEASYTAQRAQGCDVHRLTTARLKERWPSMVVDDLAGGMHSPGDGWGDPNGMLHGLRREAISLGVEFI